MSEEYEGIEPFLLKSHFLEVAVDGSRARFNVYLPTYKQGFAEVKYAKNLDLDLLCTECSNNLSKELKKIINGQSTVLASDKCPIYYAVGGALQMDKYDNAILIENGGELTFPNSPLRTPADILKPASVMLRPALEDIIILNNGKAIVPKITEKAHLKGMNKEIEDVVLDSVNKFSSGNTAVNLYGNQYDDASFITDERNTVAIVGEIQDELAEFGSSPAVMSINPKNGLMGIYGVLKYNEVNFLEALPQRVPSGQKSKGSEILYVVALGELLKSSEGDWISALKVDGGFKKESRKLYKPSSELKDVLAFLKF